VGGGELFSGNADWRKPEEAAHLAEADEAVGAAIAVDDFAARDLAILPRALTSGATCRGQQPAPQKDQSDWIAAAI
jgi:hypothetical protein